MKKFKFFLLLMLLSIYFLPLLTTAAANPTNPNPTNPNPSNPVVTLPNPLGGADKTDIPTFLGTIIKGVMGILGSLALVMFIYGGATWMLSRGNPEDVKKGQSIIIWATLGIAVIFTSYALVRFVITAISGATG